jgi:fatty acid desaturase
MMATQYVERQPGDERPVRELLSDLGAEVQHLLQSQVELAKREVKQEAGKAARAGAMFGGAAVAGFLGLLLVAFAAAWGLAEAIPVGLAFLAVGALFLAIAGLLAVQGRKRVAEVSPVPAQTIKALSEDVQTAKESLARGASADPWQQRRWS